MHIAVNSLRLTIAFIFAMGYQTCPNFAVIPLIVALSVFVINIQVAAFWWEFEMAGIDNANGSLIKTDGRLKRVDKTTFAISGTLEIVTDFSNDWQFEGCLFYSSKGNNQFTKSPLGVPRSDLCDIIDGAYKYAGAKQLAEKSDLPAPKEGESLCASYKKGKYTIRDFMFKKSSIPIFLHPGFFKAQLIFSNKDSEEVNLFSLYFKLY